MAQRSAEIRASLAQYKFNTEVRTQCVCDLVTVFEARELPIVNEVEKYVLNDSLNAMKDEYNIYEMYFYENEEEFLDDDDYEELSEELFDVADFVDKVNDQALELL